MSPFKFKSKSTNPLGEVLDSAVPEPSLSPAKAALMQERRRLAEDVAEKTWDLGGLVYEMAVREHYRLDVLTARAASLQQIDARLSEIERLLNDHQGIAGHCRFCSAPYGRSAEFCWSCGERLIARYVVVDEEEPTRVFPTGDSSQTAEHPAVTPQRPAS